MAKAPVLKLGPAMRGRSFLGDFLLRKAALESTGTNGPAK